MPGDLLGYVSPWLHQPDIAPAGPWNVLRFDGITQFYPWRLETARLVHQGRLPFWNPYAFAASGGTPLWANSQSAPLYPLNFLFYIFPIRLLWYLFGLLAAMHVEILAVGTYLFLTGCVQVRRAAALLGAGTFALCGPITCWLSLPTFVSVACWIPWLLLLIHAVERSDSWQRAVRLSVATGFVGGLMILGGHLQISLYGLALGFLYSLYLRYNSDKRLRIWHRGISYLAAAMCSVFIALSLAAPQLLPSLELSHASHRASSGFPTWTGYQSYLSNALPLRNLVTLLFPNFFGHPNASPATYWNTNNYAEWSLFTGVVPLMLSGFSLGLPWGGTDLTQPRLSSLHARGFFACVACVTLLLALGTPLNIPLFFLLPGYSQTGNSGRILVVFAFSVAVLAAIGLDALMNTSVAGRSKDRAALTSLGLPALLAAFGASRSAAFQKEELANSTLASLIAPNMGSIYVGLVVFAAGAALILSLAKRSPRAASYALVALSTAELVYWGWGYNPTVEPERIYPTTPGIRYLLKNAGSEDMIAPINRGWSLGSEGPRHAVLPPNALTVFGLHDISGYDSLFYRYAKEQVRAAANGLDPSPQENGNMVFVKDPSVAVALGARFIVTAPDAPTAVLPPSVSAVYEGDDLVIYENASAKPFDAATTNSYAPASIRFGLFGALVTMELLGFLLGATTVSAIFRRLRPRGSRSS